MSQLLLCCTAASLGEPEGLMVKLRRALTAGEAPVQMIAARVDDDFSGDRKPETIPGSPSQVTLIAAARLALPRL